jgi:hypothetical protein
MFTNLVRLFFEGMGNIEYGAPPGTGSGATPLTAANNGTSISTVTAGTVVLGNDEGDTLAQLISNREIPLNGFNLILSGVGDAEISAVGALVLRVLTLDDGNSAQIVWEAPDGTPIGDMHIDDDGAETGVGSVYIGLAAGQLGANNTLRNVAIGHYALQQNSGGEGNQAIGNNALENSNGNFNTAIGWLALNASVNQSNNVAVGQGAGESITTTINAGNDYNTMIGAGAGSNLNTGYSNTILGGFTQGQYLASSFNVIVGAAAGTPYLAAAFTSNNNVIVGSSALSTNSTYGNKNTVVGDNINNGQFAIQNNNVLIGADIQASGTVGTTLQNTMCLGYGLVTTRNNVARIARADQNVQLGWTADIADSGAKLQVNGTIQTTPPNVTAGKVRFGIEVAAAITVNLARYLEHEVDGVLYKLVTAN